MVRPSFSLATSLWAAAAIAVGCSSTRPADTNGGGPPYTGAPGSSGADATITADSGASNQKGTPDAALDDGTANEGGGGNGADATNDDDRTAVADGQSDDGAAVLPGDAGPPRCDPSRAWTPLGAIPSVPQANFARLAGVSPDELTIAWTSADGAIYVADRSARNTSFGTATVVDTSSAPVASDRAALAPSRVELVAVSADRRGFVAFNRSGVDAGASWVAAAGSQFFNVSAMIAPDVAGAFSEPVLAGNRTSFFYALAFSGAAPQLFESTWDPASSAWTTGAALPNAEFASTTSYATYATGASSDGLTLFFLDGSLGQERAAWRGTLASPFDKFVTLAGAGLDGAPAQSFLEATPNFRCDTLYFRGSASNGNGAFVAQ